MYSLDSDIGKLFVSITNKGIEQLSLSELQEDERPKTLETDEIFQNLTKPLKEYFEGERKDFDLPLNTIGTEFQKSVWRHLEQIKFGKTITYKQQAVEMNNLKGIRAIAAANGKNPIMIIIPCHRVIGSDNNLTGYAGGLENKKWLLNHEMGQMSLF